jgi:hypothetical protein
MEEIKKRLEYKFWASRYLQGNFKQFVLIPSPGIIWDTQFSDDLTDNVKGWKELTIYIDWLGFGIGFQLTINNK